MSRTFAPAQLAYLTARAAYDLAKEEADAHMAAYEATADHLEATLSPAEYAAWSASQRTAGPTPVLVRQCEALTALRAAEQALLDWCVAKVRPLAKTEAQRADLERVRTCKPWLGAYAKAIDSAMRLDA